MISPLHFSRRNLIADLRRKNKDCRRVQSCVGTLGNKAKVLLKKPESPLAICLIVSYTNHIKPIRTKSIRKERTEIDHIGTHRIV